MHCRHDRNAALRNCPRSLGLSSVGNLIDYHYIRTLVFHCLYHRSVLVLRVVNLQNAAGTDGRVRYIARASDLEALVDNRNYAVARACDRPAASIGPQ